MCNGPPQGVLKAAPVLECPPTLSASNHQEPTAKMPQNKSSSEETEVELWGKKTIAPRASTTHHPTSPQPELSDDSNYKEAHDNMRQNMEGLFGNMGGAAPADLANVELPHDLYSALQGVSSDSTGAQSKHDSPKPQDAVAGSDADAEKSSSDSAGEGGSNVKKGKKGKRNQKESASSRKPQSKSKKKKGSKDDSKGSSKKKRRT